MKKVYKIIILVVVLLICMICIIRFNNKKIIKSIRSEHQLYEFYNNETDFNLNTFERLLTMPFSLLTYDRVLNYTSSYKGVYEDVFVNDIDREEVATPSSVSKDYSKTNIQVEGVDEADIIKTDGDFIYSISNNKVIITNAKNPSSLAIEHEISFDLNSAPIDLLLYKDYLIVFCASTPNSRYKQNTLVSVYDVSNKLDVKRVKSFELYEPYYTSRCIDGNLYVFANGYLRENKDKNTVERIYKEDNITKEIALNDIKYLKNSGGIQTLIAHLDLNHMKDFDVKSYLIDMSNAYVSRNNVYLLDEERSDLISIKSLFTLKGVIGFIRMLQDYDRDIKTRIYKFEINKNKGLVFDNTTSIDGEIINQYSLDEHNNHLRIALETDDGTRIAILDDKLKVIGQTPKVAEGERMYASRFMQDKAYLVTYMNTDPLFVIDLSNEYDPKVMGELKIPGYSTYLHPYDENHLIGIGMDTEEVINRDLSGRVTSRWVKTNGMKMCLFDVSDITNPKEISKVTIGDERTVSAILTNPKALLFSKEKNLLAIPVNNYQDDFSVKYSEDYQEQIYNYKNYNKNYISEGYFVYNIDLDSGIKLNGIINHEKKLNNYYYYNNSKLLRGLYIENDLYTVSEDYIKVNNLSDLSELYSLELK